MRYIVIVLSILFFIAVSAAAKKSPAPRNNFPGRAFLYVNNNDFENTVSAFRINQDGSLQLLPGSPYPTGGIGGKTSDIGSICVCKKARRVFATNNSDNTVSGFNINPDGTLSPLPGGPIATGGEFAAGIACNKQATRIFVANVDSDSISAFTGDANGQLTPVNGSPFRTGNGPLALALNKNGSVLFASNEFSHSVSSFLIDSNGRPHQVGDFLTLGLADHGITINFNTSTVYVADLGNNSISGFSADLSSGNLTALPNAPFFTDGDLPIAVATTTDGRYVFASNNNSASITVFSVNPDGSLTELSDSPFTSDGQGPSGMVVNNLGTLLFVANGGFGGSMDISVFNILPTGEISPIAGSPFPTGSPGVPSALGILELAN